jgi:CheY-like chemotaxis protein
MKRKILWVDDEIELLKAHIIFLENKGYSLTPVTNGEDALAMIKKETFDAVLLDEMMPGMDGLTVLVEIKNIDPGLPVIMITKSEEEHIMDNAIGSRISDYLTKPVNPSQIFTTLKRLLDSSQLREERISREYARQTHSNRLALDMGLDYNAWAQMHASLAGWDIEINEFNDPGLKQIHADQKREFRREFSKYVEKNYHLWIQGNGPDLSHNILDTYVVPRLRNGEKVYLIVIDCFRLDHWLAIEPKLEKIFTIDRNYYYSILPTATPFSRNAFFAGLLPVDINKIYPDIWRNAGHDEISMNRYESNLLELYLKRKGIHLDRKLVYEKILKTDDAQTLYKRLGNLKQNQFISIVYNFIDLLSHQRSENDMLMEIAPDEAAFRSLTTTWFDHSVLIDVFNFIADEGATLILTTDHGSIIGERASIVRGDRTTSTNIRYKYGKKLKCNPSEVFSIDNPREYGLPQIGINTNYLFAK